MDVARLNNLVDQPKAPVVLGKRMEDVEVTGNQYQRSPQSRWSGKHTELPKRPNFSGIGKMRKCGMRNAESKMRNAKCGMHVRNGV